MKYKNFLGKLYFFSILVTFFLPLSTEKVFAIQLLTPEQRFWTTNAEVDSIVYSPDSETVYIGGNFTRVAPYTGSGVPFSTRNNPPQQISNFPKVSGGSVDIVIADNQGGWYIGGNFKKVGDLPREKIAHIFADGSVDQNLSLYVNNPVNTLAFDSANHILYVAGKFTSIGGQTRNRVASINTDTGQLTNWNPNISGQYSYVNSLALDAARNVIYIGGYFRMVGGQQRINLAGIETVTGLPTSVIINADESVQSFAMDNNILYVGGGFTTINGQTRKGLASIDIITGQLSSFNIGASGIENNASELVLDSERNILYVGGCFSFVATSSEKCLFAVNTLTSQLTNWNPIVTQGSFIGALSLDSVNNLLYVGGSVSYNNSPQLTLSSVDTTTGQPTNWNLAPFGYVNTLGSDSSRRLLYVGGEFGSIGGEERKGLASFNVTTGELTDWNPGTSFNNTSGAVHDMIFDPQHGILYVGGGFTSIGGQSRSNLAAFDAKSGLLTSWNPVFDTFGTLTTLALDSAAKTLYVGGHFTSIGGQPRNRVGSVNIITGQPTNWDPAPVSSLFTVNIFELVLDIPNNLVYVGGVYDSMGGQERKNLAAVDMTTGLATNWNPRAWNPKASIDISAVLSLDLDSPKSDIYVGGSFKAIGNTLRTGLASVDTVTGLANSWNPSLVNSYLIVHDIARDTSANILYAAESSEGNGIIGIDTITGVMLWDPQVHYTVGTVLFDPIKKFLYVGGPFFQIDAQERRGFAVFASPIDVAGNLAPAATVFGAKKEISLLGELFGGLIKSVLYKLKIFY